MPNGKGGSNRGFAAMDPEKQKEISRKGGLSVAPKDRSFSRDRNLASNAGRKGAISRNADRRSQSSMNPANQNAGGSEPGQVQGSQRDDVRDIDTEDTDQMDRRSAQSNEVEKAASGSDRGSGMSAGESDASAEEDRRSTRSDDDDEGMR